MDGVVVGKPSSTSRSGMMDGVAVGKPSSTSRSGMMNGVVVGKPGSPSRSGLSSGEPSAPLSATSHSGTMRAVQPAKAPVADPELAYGRGMMLDDNPFSDAFTGQDGPVLELANANSVEPPAPPAEEPVPEVEEPPQQVRARVIAEIAKYGPRPTSPLQQPLYWFRVMNRKRVLTEELAALSAQRKRADDQAQEALASLGEALLALRESSELAALEKQFAAVQDAEDRVGHAAAAGQKRRAGVAHDLARLKNDLTRAEGKAAPLREREAQLAEHIESLKTMVRLADVHSRKADAELEALRAKGGGDPERWAAVAAEREARLGEFQTLGVQLAPLEDELEQVRSTLAEHLRTISSIQEERRSAATALERAQQNQRVSVGSARGARVSALISLANASLKLGLHEFVPDYSEAVVEADERAEKARHVEELARAAANSYDHIAYARGFAMLLGSSVLLFLSLAIAILF
jgi:hypothetical protein